MKKILLYTALISLSVSCSDFLTTQPSDFMIEENYYKTEKHFETALVSVYDALGQRLDQRMGSRVHLGLFQSGIQDLHNQLTNQNADDQDDDCNQNIGSQRQALGHRPVFNGFPHNFHSFSVFDVLIIAIFTVESRAFPFLRKVSLF